MEAAGTHNAPSSTQARLEREASLTWPRTSNCTPSTPAPSPSERSSREAASEFAHGADFGRGSHSGSSRTVRSERRRKTSGDGSRARRPSSSKSGPTTRRSTPSRPSRRRSAARQAVRSPAASGPAASPAWSRPARSRARWSSRQATTPSRRASVSKKAAPAGKLPGVASPAARTPLRQTRLMGGPPARRRGAGPAPCARTRHAPGAAANPRPRRRRPGRRRGPRRSIGSG